MALTDRNMHVRLGWRYSGSIPYIAKFLRKKGQKMYLYIYKKIVAHSMARANLNKSKEVLTWISIDADSGPLGYVLWRCGSISQDFYTFIQMGLAILWSRSFRHVIYQIPFKSLDVKMNSCIMPLFVLHRYFTYQIIHWN